MEKIDFMELFPALQGYGFRLRPAALRLFALRAPFQSGLWKSRRT